MAITGRAARDIVLDQHNTPDVVGPGPYLSVEREPPVHGFAPFCSTVERRGPSEVPLKTQTPGPGVYETLGKPRQVSNFSGAAFVSKVNRMPAPEGAKAHRLTPGPGAYAVRDDWNASASCVGASKLTKSNRTTITKRNPPSIPVAEQSYGYEETAQGELEMQPPPQNGYDGVSGHRSVGPGEYETDKAAKWTKPAACGAHFGNSRVTRNVFSFSPKQVPTPGPGAYSSETMSMVPPMGKGGG